MRIEEYQFLIGRIWNSAAYWSNQEHRILIGPLVPLKARIVPPHGDGSRVGGLRDE